MKKWQKIFKNLSIFFGIILMVEIVRTWDKDNPYFSLCCDFYEILTYLSVILFPLFLILFLGTKYKLFEKIVNNFKKEKLDNKKNTK